MIKIITQNEHKEGFDLEVTMHGRGDYIAKELIAIFDHIYKFSPEIFEAALVSCKYTEDHT
jgi:hypothetical protein